jgi:hypothetical protein
MGGTELALKVRAEAPDRAQTSHLSGKSLADGEKHPNIFLEQAVGHSVTPDGVLETVR